MMMWRLFSWLLAATLIAGCATAPPGANFPKSPSSAFDSPEITTLGKRMQADTAKHAGTSGFRILTMGVDGFLTRAQMINRAERTIDLQYFIFRNDESGQLLADALLHAADRGVRVRILLDDGETVDGDEKIAALQAHPHIEVRVFNPFAYRGHVELFRAAEFVLHHDRLDYRMHNKLLVVDNTLALIGGRNIADGYFQIDPEEQFGDDDVFSVGPVVRQLSSTYDDYWNSALAIPSEALEPASQAALSTYRQTLKEHREHLKDEGASYALRIDSGEPLEGMLSGRLALTWANATVVCDSPEKSKVEKGEIIGKLMHRKVGAEVSAVQTELLMVSPYLIPGEDGMKMFDGLHGQGVRIRILTNSLMTSNVLPAQAGYMRYRKPLLADGTELYEVRALLGDARGSGQTTAMNRYGNYGLHAKLFVFDRKKLFIGSMNFDQRSMHLNTEVGLIIDSEELARQTAARFEAIVKPANSYQVTEQSDAPEVTPHLTWHTEEKGQPVDYSEEPSPSVWRRLKVKLLSILPLDREL